MYLCCFFLSLQQLSVVVQLLCRLSVVAYIGQAAVLCNNGAVALLSADAWLWCLSVCLRPAFGNEDYVGLFG